MPRKFSSVFFSARRKESARDDDAPVCCVRVASPASFSALGSIHSAIARPSRIPGTPSGSPLLPDRGNYRFHHFCSGLRVSGSAGSVYAALLSRRPAHSRFQFRIALKGSEARLFPPFARGAGASGYAYPAFHEKSGRRIIQVCSDAPASEPLAGQSSRLSRGMNRGSNGNSCFNRLRNAMSAYSVRESSRSRRYREAPGRVCQIPQDRDSEPAAAYRDSSIQNWDSRTSMRSVSSPNR